MRCELKYVAFLLIAPFMTLIQPSPPDVPARYSGRTTRWSLSYSERASSCAPGVPTLQPVTPSIQPSIHQPSSTDSDGTPLKAAFIPLVPEASIGGSGVLTHTSTPATRSCAAAMS